MARTRNGHNNGETVEFAYIQFEFCFQMENGNGILKTRGTLTPVAGHGGRPGGRHGHGHGGRPRANLKILSCQSTGTMVLIIAHQSLPVYEFTTDPDGPSKIVHETPNETLTERRHAMIIRGYTQAKHAACARETRCTCAPGVVRRAAYGAMISCREPGR